MIRDIVMAMILTAVVGSSTQADEVTYLLDNANSAYVSGNIDEALSITHNAVELMQGVELEQFLPAPPNGWTRDIVAHGLMATLSNMYQGRVGSAVKAQYVNGEKRIELVLISERVMLIALGGVGENEDDVLMISGRKFTNRSGAIDGISRAMLIWVNGDVPLDDKIALIEQLDFTAIDAFPGH